MQLWVRATLVPAITLLYSCFQISPSLCLSAPSLLLPSSVSPTQLWGQVCVKPSMTCGPCGLFFNLGVCTCQDLGVDPCFHCLRMQPLASQCTHQGSQPSSSCLCLEAHMSFTRFSGDLNSALHTCTANTLTTEVYLTGPRELPASPSAVL